MSRLYLEVRNILFSPKELNGSQERRILQEVDVRLSAIAALGTGVIKK